MWDRYYRWMYRVGGVIFLGGAVALIAIPIRRSGRDLQ